MRISMEINKYKINKIKQKPKYLTQFFNQLFVVEGGKFCV